MFFKIGVFSFYFITIGIFFLKLPINGSLYGDIDTWGNLSMFKDLMFQIENIFQSKKEVQFLFPSSNYRALYGLDYFSGLIWIIFFKVGFTEVWAYWFYISILLSLNSTSLYYLSRLFIKNNTICIFLSLIFSVSFITYSNIDNPNAISYFFTFVAIYSFFKMLYFKCPKYFLLFSICSGLQIYFSPTVFIILFCLCFFLIIYFLFRYNNLGAYKYIIISVFLITIIISPYFFHYIFTENDINFIFYSKEMKKYYDLYLSLDLMDLFRFYPNHHFYKLSSNLDYPFVILKHLFPGFGIMLFFLIGIFNKNNIPLLILILFFFLLGCGNYIYVNNNFIVKNPLSFIFYESGIENFLRVPSRMNMIIFLLISFISFRTLNQIIITLNISDKLVFVILLAITVESAAYPIRQYDSENTMKSFGNLKILLKEKREKANVLLNIPTGLFSIEKDRREMLYMYNNYDQKQKILNGVAAYYPKSRLNINETMNDSALNTQKFCNLLNEYGVTRVVIHEKLIYDKSDSLQVQVAKYIECLILEADIENYIIYTVK